MRCHLFLDKNERFKQLWIQIGNKYWSSRRIKKQSTLIIGQLTVLRLRYSVWTGPGKYAWNAKGRTRCEQSHRIRSGDVLYVVESLSCPFAKCSGYESNLATSHQQIWDWINERSEYIQRMVDQIGSISMLFGWKAEGEGYALPFSSMPKKGREIWTPSTQFWRKVEMFLTLVQILYPSEFAQLCVISWRALRRISDFKKEGDDFYHDNIIAGEITYQQRLSLPYLQAIIKESTRLYPSILY